MAARLRKILLKSEIEAESSRTLADRLNVALENMTHGIAMFNEEGGLVVMNDRFRELAKLSGWDAEKKPLSIVKPEVSEWSANKDLYQTLSNRLRSRHSARFRFKADKGHTLEADFNSMNNGGVVVISDITENVKAERVIRDLANFDPLTDLPNRRHFMEQMNNLKRQDGSLNECAMFFVDLDKFKEINDTLGHAVGDRLLQVVSERLRRLLPSDGLICRFGGDEFVLVVRDMQSQKDCQMFAEKIIAEMRAVFVVSTHRLNIAASVGIAIAPEQGTNAEELLQRTDAALYKAKGNGRSTFVFFTEELGSTLRERSQLEKDLKIAIEDESIEVYFQPLINLKRGRISTCEALSRWEHSEFGRVSPEVFIRIAEEAGMIADLGHYVLKRSMVIASKWPEHVRVAVNVSSVQFRQKDFCEQVEALLQETGFPSNRLELEITESMMLENIEEATGLLKRLSKLGIRISLDDFGTGFSSLSYLHTLPFDKVKIDRSFIEHAMSDDRALTLLKGIVDLIKRLGQSIVLEGIENEEQMAVLFRNVDVHEVQGYLFSRPLPASDIFSLLWESNPTESRSEVA